MVLSKHSVLGDIEGNPQQSRGRHRENEMEIGIGYIPHGDRNRSLPEFNELEDRDSDPNIGRI